MATKLLKTFSPEETMVLGEKLGKQLKKGMIIELIGDLGAGKTQLSKGIAKGLGSQDIVTSPTFALMQIYSGDMPIYHIDGYRLADEEAAYMSGLEEAFTGDGIALVEWGAVVAPLYDGRVIEIEITKINEIERKIEIRGEIDGFSWN